MYEKSVFLPDLHVPYHDERAYSTALAFICAFKPDIIYIMGDWMDFYELSKFDRNPDRRFKLQEELDTGRAKLEALCKSSTNSKKIYLEGNHEHRMTRYLWTKADELSGLRCLAILELLHLKAMGIKYVPGGRTRFHDFIVKHGNLVRKHAAYTAKGEMDDEGRSGISGHTHRLGVYYKTDDTGMRSWTECGCLCDLRPEYMEGRIPNWQHGLGYGYFRRTDRRFEVHQLPIIKGTITWNGKEIKG